MDRVHNSRTPLRNRLPILALALLALLAATDPAAACVSSPPFPPIWIDGDVCEDGEVRVIFHDFFTFTATNQVCSCALNLPLSIGEVTSVELVEVGTGNVVSAFDFAANPAADFGGGLDWQGFSSIVDDVEGGLSVDLVFHVQPTEFRCDDNAGRGLPGVLQAKGSGLEFNEILGNALREPEGGAVLGTGGADDDGTPNHHVAVRPPGPVDVAVGGGDEQCSTAAQSPCAVDLKTGKLSESCFSTPGLAVVDPPSDSNGDRWLEATFKVKLSGRCARRACVVLDYSQAPKGFTFNIGDSETNDGSGGNAGGPESEAEVDILNNRMTVWSVGHGPGMLDRLPVQDLGLEASAFKVCVSNQTVTYGQPFGRSFTPWDRELFAIPDPFDGNRDIFIGLNRVIRTLGGPPAKPPGSGLRHAYISID